MEAFLQLRFGYHPEDFNMGNKSAYFALDKASAKEYSYHYGEGVIEIKVPKTQNEQFLKQYKQPLPGRPGEIEIPVPQKHFDILNLSERLHHHE